MLQRRDGTTETAHIGSPYLAVMFEQTFHRVADGAHDNGWMAFLDLQGRPPADDDELNAWLKDFIGTDVTEYVPPDPTATAPNGTGPPEPSSPT